MIQGSDWEPCRGPKSKVDRQNSIFNFGVGGNWCLIRGFHRKKKLTYIWNFDFFQYFRTFSWFFRWAKKRPKSWNPPPAKGKGRDYIWVFSHFHILKTLQLPVALTLRTGSLWEFWDTFLSSTPRDLAIRRGVKPRVLRHMLRICSDYGMFCCEMFRFGKILPFGGNLFFCP